MNAVPLLLRDEPRLSYNQPTIYYPAAPPRKVRVAVFGIFLGGYHVLKEPLAGNLVQRIQVVGIATDDPIQSFTHPTVRLWKYPHSREDELLVPRFAAAQGLPVFTR